MPLPKAKPINSKWFREKIESRGMTLRGLAREIGMEASAVSLMLRGLRGMSVQEAVAIANCLGVPVADVARAVGAESIYS